MTINNDKITITQEISDILINEETQFDVGCTGTHLEGIKWENGEIIDIKRLKQFIAMIYAYLNQNSYKIFTQMFKDLNNGIRMSVPNVDMIKFQNQLLILLNVVSFIETQLTTNLSHSKWIPSIFLAWTSYCRYHLSNHFDDLERFIGPTSARFESISSLVGGSHSVGSMNTGYCALFEIMQQIGDCLTMSR